MAQYIEVASDIRAALQNTHAPGVTPWQTDVFSHLGLFANGVCLLSVAQALWTTIGLKKTARLEQICRDHVNDEGFVTSLRDIFWSVSYADGMEALRSFSRECAPLHIIMDLLRIRCWQPSRCELQNAEIADAKGGSGSFFGGNLRHRIVRHDVQSLTCSIDVFFSLLFLVVRPRSFLRPFREQRVNQSKSCEGLVNAKPAELLTLMLPEVWYQLTCNEACPMTCTESADLWRLLVLRPVFGLIARESLIDEFPEVLTTSNRAALLHLCHTAVLIAASKIAEIAGRLWTALDGNKDGKITRQVFLDCFIGAVSDEVLWPVVFIAAKLGEPPPKRTPMPSEDRISKSLRREDSATSSVVINAASCSDPALVMKLVLLNVTDAFFGRDSAAPQASAEEVNKRSELGESELFVVAEGKGTSNSDAPAYESPCPSSAYVQSPRNPRSSVRIQGAGDPSSSVHVHATPEPRIGCTVDDCNRTYSWSTDWWRHVGGVECKPHCRSEVHVVERA
eukprot:TRINITY_DN11520_c0_g1_i2.p1 TRINITY_DN11520_c0_g1~~TRINITY_DN11520_c0_g1_i2.p1  ORF type:complete len:560 (+),score=60.38 TRINITY_DN11520_c0_g1_i2:160-1680(+)